MKSFKVMREAYADKKEETIQTVLKMWTGAVDIENIAKHVNKTVDQVKKIIRTAKGKDVRGLD